MHKERCSCDEDIKDPEEYHQFDNLRFKRCFCNYYDPNIYTLIKISDVLDKTGSIKSAYIASEVMSMKMQRHCSIIKQYKLEYEAEQIRKQNEEMKRKAKKR